VPEAQEPVRRADLDHHVERLNTRIEGVGKQVESLMTKHGELDSYTKQSVHELRNGLQQIALKIEANNGQHSATLARITALLEAMRMAPKAALPVLPAPDPVRAAESA
jgi:hypothetical protein